MLSGCSFMKVSYFSSASFNDSKFGSVSTFIVLICDALIISQIKSTLLLFPFKYVLRSHGPQHAPMGFGTRDPHIQIL